MARHLAPSPLPARVAPPEPPRSWLWEAPDAYDGLLLPDGPAAAPLLHRHAGHAREVRAMDGALALIFAAPVQLDPGALGHALPLKRRGEGLATYAADPEPGTVLAILGGEQRVWRLAESPPRDPLDFWDLRAAVAPGRAMPMLPKREPRRMAQRRVLQAVDDDKLFEQVRNQVDDTPDSQIMGKAARGAAGALGLVLRLGLMVAWLGLIALLLIGSLATGAIIPALIVLAILWLLSRIGPRTADGGREARRGGPAQGAGGGRGGAGERPGAPRGPGWFDRMLGWAMWNTPMGDKMRRELDRNIQEVRKMIARGEIDRALKRAYSVGKAEADKRQAAMRRLPKPRATLDLDFGPRLGSAGFLSSAGLHQLTAEYRALAKKLAADGDFKRAAFIYAELLGDIAAALSALEEMGAYEEAAKLATVRKRPGHEQARYWFLAGNHEVALAVAKRHGVLAYVAGLAGPRDTAFARMARRHWIQVLVAAGDVPRAIAEAARDAAFGDVLDDLLAQAVAEDDLDDPAVLALAALSCDWPAEALVAPAPGPLAQRLHRLSCDPEADAERAALLHALKDARQTPLTGKAAALADSLIRGVLAWDAESPAAPDQKALSRLARDLGLSVLSEDLRHIVRDRQPKPAKWRSHSLGRAAGRAAWTMVAPGAGDRAVVASPEGEVTLVDGAGRRLWTDYVPGLAALVPIDGGRNVLTVRSPGPEAELAVLDTRQANLRRLGRIDLLAWADRAGPDRWVVQSTEAIAALDLGALLASEPAVETLWSIAQPTPLRLVAVLTAQPDTIWITQRDVSGGQPGLLEHWVLTSRGMDLRASLVVPGSPQQRSVYTEPHHVSGGLRLISPDQTLAEGKAPVVRSLLTVPYSWQQEQAVLRDHGSFLDGLQDFARLSSVAGPGPVLVRSRYGSPTVEFGSRPGWLVVQITGLEIRAQFGTRNRQVLLDGAGRLISVDLVSMKASVLSL